MLAVDHAIDSAARDRVAGLKGALAGLNSHIALAISAGSGEAGTRDVKRRTSTSHHCVLKVRIFGDVRRSTNQFVAHVHSTTVTGFEDVLL